jgi:hypothetical protein
MACTSLEQLSITVPPFSRFRSSAVDVCLYGGFFEHLATCLTTRRGVESGMPVERLSIKFPWSEDFSHLIVAAKKILQGARSSLDEAMGYEAMRVKDGVSGRQMWRWEAGTEVGGVEDGMEGESEVEKVERKI